MAKGLTWLILIVFLHSGGSFTNSEFELMDRYYIDNFEVYEVREREGKMGSHFPKELIIESLEYLNQELDVLFDERIPIILVNKKNEGRLGEFKEGVIFIYLHEEKDPEFLKKEINKTLLHELGHKFQEEFIQEEFIEIYRRDRGIKDEHLYLKDEVFSEDFSAIFSIKELRLYYNQTEYPFISEKNALILKDKILNDIQKKYERRGNYETNICSKQEGFSGFLESK